MIDRYLNELGSHLRVGGRRRARILEEVRDHLHDAVADRESRGIDRERALQDAVSAFGPADRLAVQFNAQVATVSMRRIPFIAVTAGVTVVGGFLLAVTTPSRRAFPASARVGVQASFLVAVLGLQVAFVAGARAASLVASHWRSPAAPTQDRDLVHRAGAICASGLGVAAVGWTSAVLLTLHRLAHPHALGVAGTVVMIASAATAAVLIARQPVNPDDEGDASPERAGVLEVGEHLIGAAKRRPAPSCAAVATLGAPAAMPHAETSVIAAVPWGLGQAAAVVTGVVSAGALLGSRTGCVGSGPRSRSPEGNSHGWSFGSSRIDGGSRDRVPRVRFVRRSRVGVGPAVVDEGGNAAPVRSDRLLSRDARRVPVVVGHARRPALLLEGCESCVR